MRVMQVVGARPNFMKVAPIMRALRRTPARFEQILVHTGQHYDYALSEVFFRDLGLTPPDFTLDVGSGSHAEQTARIMTRFEPVLRQVRPDWLLVVGDVNSTLACALVAAKLGVRVAHVEAGLRAHDRTMPEEINRILTDHLADLLLTSAPEGGANLLREGIAPAHIHFVGNVMIDSLVACLPQARALPVGQTLGIGEAFALVTLHRPGNVDDPATLRRIMEGLAQVAQLLPVVFPVHPRTRKALGPTAPQLRLCEPLGYLEFLALTDKASLVITDSGGLQEETSFLGVPCLTVRPNTERTVTITHGTNQLVAADAAAIEAAARQVLGQKRTGACAIPKWDGHAAERIADVLARQA